MQSISIFSTKNKVNYIKTSIQAHKKCVEHGEIVDWNIMRIANQPFRMIEIPHVETHEKRTTDKDNIGES